MRWAFLFAKIVDICRNGAKKVGISRKIFACREKSQMCFRWQIFLLLHVLLDRRNSFSPALYPAKNRPIPF